MNKKLATMVLLATAVGGAFVVRAIAVSADPIGVADELPATSGPRYFAEVDADGIVKRVIVADPAFLNSGALGKPGNWVETSMDGSVRKNYAAIGDRFDKTTDSFVPPKPFPSWSLDANTARWESPKAYPKDGKEYYWDEAKTDWSLTK